MCSATSEQSRLNLVTVALHRHQGGCRSRVRAPCPAPNSAGNEQRSIPGGVRRRMRRWSWPGCRWTRSFTCETQLAGAGEERLTPPGILRKAWACFTPSFLDVKIFRPDAGPGGWLPSAVKPVCPHRSGAERSAGNSPIAPDRTPDRPPIEAQTHRAAELLVARRTSRGQSRRLHRRGRAVGS